MSLALGIFALTTAHAATEYVPDAKTIFLWHLNSPETMCPKDTVFSDAGPNKLDAKRGKGDVKMGIPSVPGLQTGISGFAGSRLLKVGPSPKLMNIEKGFTLEMWVKDPLTGNGWKTDSLFSVLAQYRVTSRKIQWFFTINHKDKSLGFTTIAEGMNYIYVSVRSKALKWKKGSWYHIAATCDVLGSNRIMVKIYRSRAGNKTVTLLAEKIMQSTNDKLKLYSVMQSGEICIGGAGSGSRFLGTQCCIDEVRYSSVAREPEDFVEHITGK